MPNRPPLYRPPGARTAAETEESRKRFFQATRRDGDVQAFYTSTPWRRLRARFLAENPLCVRCAAAGRTTAATIADHKLEVKDRPDLALDIHNLDPLCLSCHNSKTATSVNKRRQLSQ